MTATVRMNGLTMNGVADSDGDTFRIYDIEGLDSPEIEAGLTYITPDGVNIDWAQIKQRELLIRGNAWGPFTNEAAIWRVRQKIENALATMIYNGTTVYFDFPSPGNSYQMVCRHLGKLHFPQPNATVQGFEIPLTAPDPFKYSQTISNVTINGGTGTVTNTGNYPTRPVAYLQSSGSNLYLQNNNAGGSRLTIDGSGIGITSFPSGTSIDFGTRTMFVPGIGNADIIALPRTWWSLAPGDNSISVSGNWRIEYRSAGV